MQYFQYFFGEKTDNNKIKKIKINIKSHLSKKVCIYYNKYIILLKNLKSKLLYIYIHYKLTDFKL